MQQIERFAYISEVLRREGTVSVKFLAETLGVSESTVRRDLQRFLKMTQLPLKRIRGGLLLDIDKGAIEPVYQAKLSIMKQEKIRIANKALEYIEDNDSIILDSGTTSLQLARLLYKKRGLKVITMDVKLAEELAAFSEIETYIIAGHVRPGYYSIGGALAEQCLSQFTVDKGFLTADAVDPDAGVTNSSMFEVGVKKTLVQVSKKVILLADHSKIGKKALIKVCDLSEIDVFITSHGGAPELLEAIAQKVPEVVQV
ncbi:MAG: DeoR/GlpR family DNA-binding transcription regulator [Candidatus Bathyarchaeia archaeon]